MIVYSQNYVVFPPLSVSQLELNNPLIGWRNIVVGSGLEADTEQDGFPVGNLATPMTYQRWRGEGSVAFQYITVTNSGLIELDYLAVAGHNFSTGGYALCVEGALALDSDGNFDWMEITPEVTLADNGPLLFRFDTAAAYLAVRLRIGPSDVDPFAAVMYVGKLLILPRRIYVGHSPMKLNQKSEMLNGMGETGEFLGRITLRESSESNISMKNVSPTFYRSDIKLWIDASKTIPFFFVWRPYTYSSEVSFCWGTANGTVSNEKSNGTMQFNIPLQGIVE